MHEIRVLIDTTCDVLREANPDEEYDGDDLDWSWSVCGYTTALSQYGENAHVANLNPTLYSVIVSYDTGDSFHREDNRYCFIDAFSDEALANALAQQISEKGREGASVSYVNDAGETTTTYCGTWSGYFESFNYVEVVPTPQATKRYR